MKENADLSYIFYKIQNRKTLMLKTRILPIIYALNSDNKAPATFKEGGPW